MRLDELLARVDDTGGTRVLDVLDGGACVYVSDWDEIALALAVSARVGGQVWWSDTGLAHVQGRRVSYAVRADAVGYVQRLRAIASALGVETVGWSVGAVARALLRWVGAGGIYSEHARRAVSGRYHYYKCVRSQGAQGTLWDIDGAYYQLMLRMPYPNPIFLSPTRWVWSGASSETLERWQRVLSAVREEKVLRNALVGSALGAEDGVACAVGGRVQVVGVRPSAWVGMGAVVVRTLYELCGLEAEREAARYANTDCVLLAGEGEPTRWGDFAISYSRRAQGEYDVRGVGVYKCGAHATLPYARAGVACVGDVLGVVNSCWSWEVARDWLAWLV